MVVLHHNELDRTLWGPASTAGRSRATDVAIYIQLALVASLGITCALDYDKPEAVRLAAAGVALLMYFRSTALFIRLMMFVSAIVLYGDILLPISRLAKAGEMLPLPAAKLLLHCIWIWNMLRILYAIFRSGTLTSGARKKWPMQGVRRMRPKVA
ncbi:nipped-B-like protein [Phytophthora cinnamomi]|uniref:nipped-B-like protein n=1 Tax=Phytophthora cinnamomi TaxID=4785 RepID=UPI003559A2A6|nr:nipped-B-like protein [Phytophthora cinnamomi]